MKRIARYFYGVASVIPPQTPGAIAQCAFCEWGRFFRANKRKRYSALARACASLRDHARRAHPDKFPQISTPEQIFGREV